MRLRARGPRALIVCLVALGVGASEARASETEGPFRVDSLVPGDAISISLNHRTRYEYVNDQVRRGQRGDDRGVFLRTLLHGELRPFESIDLRLGAELQDSRAYETKGTRLNPTMVNSAELLRAYLEWRQPDLAGGRLRVQAGRMTLDLGSRRLVARNRFRNTINAFTGVDIEWRSDDASELGLRAFWVLPVDRRPRTPSQRRLRDNDVEMDEESFDLQFWGLAVSRAFGGACDCSVDASLLGLHEDDSPERPSANRNLWTHGLRILRRPRPGSADFHVEVALQHGRSRSSSASANRADLDHLAHFEHVEFGYTFDAPWRPRIAFQYDYASGDDNPNDDENNRFDSLFGGRRFDYMPTGIYGPFFRSNLNTPGLRIQLRPHANFTSFVSYRAFWLASDRDVWVGSGFQDATGTSGSFLGHHVEVRGRWEALPGNLRIEAGYAHLFDGEYIRSAPGATGQGDSDYVYTQAILSF